jgi:epoxyqueuosine reductase
MVTAESIRREIERLVAEDPGNRLEGGEGPYFEAPLVGFASAVDPLFERYRNEEIVGSFHLTPKELFEEAFGEGSFTGGTVACWILPIAKEVRRSNRAEERLPSAPWAKTRDRGERFNVFLRRSVVELLEKRGHRSLAPLLSPRWHLVPVTPLGFASTWSERHAAYAAGLGTFGLSDGFITPRGIAHRIGSVVTDLVLPPDERPYEGHRENCLFFNGGKCGVCIKRCPAGAVTERGHDKKRCREHLGVTMREVGPQWAITSEAGCGLCQTGVPCESRIPRRKAAGA